MLSSLPDAIRSVTEQNCPYVEVIVVNDGEKKGLNTALKSAGITKTDIKLINIAHSGKPVAVNRGLEAAKGDYFIILDADDQLPDGSLKSHTQSLKSKNADLSLGSFEVVFENKVQSKRSVAHLIGKDADVLINSLLTSIISPFHQNAMMFSRTLVEHAGKMDEQMSRGQDKEYAARLLKNARTIAMHTDSVYYYNRYYRPFRTRIWNRCIGIKYKLIIIRRYSKGWRSLAYALWLIVVESAKLLHDLFGIYKK